MLVLAEEYPSGIYTWRSAARRSGAEILTVVRGPDQTWADTVLAALDERVAIVSVPNVHWTDGALVDLPRVADRGREIGARLVIDGSQSVGAMPLDLNVLRPDFLVTVGYKWRLGPLGVGYMYVAQEHWEGEPLEENWILRAASEDFTRLVDYRDEYQPGARRFGAGQRTKFELLPMAIAALEQIAEWEVTRIAATLGAWTAKIAQRAAGLGLKAAPQSQRGPQLLGMRLPEAARASSTTRRCLNRCSRSPETRRESVGNQAVRRPVGVTRDPSDSHAPDPRIQIEDLLGERDELGIARYALAREMGHDNVGVAASIDAVESELGRVSHASKQRPVLRDDGADDADELDVRCEDWTVCSVEHIADGGGGRTCACASVCA